MCGLVGAFGRLSFQIENGFEDLLQMNVIRGEHSTGVALVKDLNNEPIIIKDVMLPTRLLQDDRYINETKTLNHLMMGHGRYATVGKINKRNAHPIKKKHIFLTHNGTITTTYDLPIFKGFDTDTEEIANNIANVGIKETWPNLSGSASLVWWDKKEQTLNFITNGKRPLFFIETVDNGCLLWASESWMLRGICKRRNIKIKKNTIFYPLKNMLFSFKLDGNSLKKTSIELEEFSWFNRFPITPIRAAWGGPSEKSTVPKWLDPHFPVSKGDRRRRKKEERKREQNPVIFSDLPQSESLVSDDLLARNQMKEDAFLKQFKSCTFCEDAFNTAWDYEQAVILDDFNAVCGDCVALSEMHNITLNKETLL